MAAEFYAQPSYMAGGLFTVYSGSRRQRGGSFLGSVKKYIVPAGRTALRGVKAAGRLAVKGVKAAAKNEAVREVAKKALEHGLMIGTNVAVDALQGRNVGEAIKERAREHALQTLTGAPAVNTTDVTPTARAVSQPKRRKRKRSRKLKQSTPAIGKPNTQPAAKRRRTELSRARLNRRQLF